MEGYESKSSGEHFNRASAGSLKNADKQAEDDGNQEPEI